MKKQNNKEGIDTAPIGCYFIVEREVCNMEIKEMRKELGLTQEMFSKRYNIPKRTIQNWESGKRNAPPYVIELLENAIKHHTKKTEEEIMASPLTVIDLKIMCDDLIRKGYGELPIMLSNDTEETGYHGMYYGFGDETESTEYITLN